MDAEYTINLHQWWMMFVFQGSTPGASLTKLV